MQLLTKNESELTPDEINELTKFLEADCNLRNNYLDIMNDALYVAPPNSVLMKLIKDFMFSMKDFIINNLKI